MQIILLGMLGNDDHVSPYFLKFEGYTDLYNNFRHQYASKESSMKILYLVVAMLVFSVNATAEESSGDREILKK